MRAVRAEWDVTGQPGEDELAITHLALGATRRCPRVTLIRLGPFLIVGAMTALLLSYVPTSSAPGM